MLVALAAGAFAVIGRSWWERRRRARTPPVEPMPEGG
jgi:hypothetical protein